MCSEYVGNNLNMYAGVETWPNAVLKEVKASESQQKETLLRLSIDESSRVNFYADSKFGTRFEVWPTAARQEVTKSLSQQT